MDPDSGALMTKIAKNLQLEKIKNFLDQNLHLPIPRPPIQDVQVTKEAFSSQKRTSSTSKHEISTFLTFWVNFALLDPDTDSPD
jgi:hypothetical protein